MQLWPRWLTIHSPAVYRVSTECLQSVYRVSTECLQSVYRVSTECQQSVNRVSTECQQSVNRVSEECLQSVYRVSTECLQSVCRVSTHTYYLTIRSVWVISLISYLILCHPRCSLLTLHCHGLFIVYKLILFVFLYFILVCQGVSDKSDPQHVKARYKQKKKINLTVEFRFII